MHRKQKNKIKARARLNQTNRMQSLCEASGFYSFDRKASFVVSFFSLSISTSLSFLSFCFFLLGHVTHVPFQFCKVNEQFVLLSSFPMSYDHKP
jgi:hypothetical protein